VAGVLAEVLGAVDGADGTVLDDEDDGSVDAVPSTGVELVIPASASVVGAPSSGGRVSSPSWLVDEHAANTSATAVVSRARLRAD
jgi:hypothetical protein